MTFCDEFSNGGDKVVRDVHDCFAGFERRFVFDESVILGLALIVG